MDRKAELLSLCNDLSDNVKCVILPLIDDLVYQEQQLAEFRKAPFVHIEKSQHDPEKTRARIAPAFEVYKNLMQQYRSNLVVLLGAVDKQRKEQREDAKENDDTSPLREYLKRLKEQT